MLVYQECVSSYGWVEQEILSSNPEQEPYIVTIPPWDRIESEISCSCKGYEFRGHCRHQREALSSLCHWREGNGKTQTDDQKKTRICPDCFGPTRVVVEEDE